MSGLLSVVLGIVGIVGAIATGGVLGLVAGGLIAASMAAQAGLIGGSVGKFMKSGWGQGLIAAVSLGSAAYGMFAQGAQAAATASLDQTAVADTASTAGGAAGTAGATAGSSVAGQASDAAQAVANDAAGTTGQFMASNGVTTLQASATGDAGAVTPGLTASQIQVANAQVEATAAQNGVIPPDAVASNTAQQTLTANASQQSQTATAEAQARVQPTAQPGGGMTPDQNAAMTAANSQPENAIQQGANSYGGGGGTGVGGAIKSVAGAIDAHPGLATVAGQGLVGLAQGISANKQMEQMFQMQNWGNEQWQDPNQVSALQKAAAAPITVPSGYLNRAAAVRSLMQGNSGQTGPVMGPQPAATGAAAAAPTGAAASGNPTPGNNMAQNGPVPVYQMAATPKGGVI